MGHSSKQGQKKRKKRRKARRSGLGFLVLPLVLVAVVGGVLLAARLFLSPEFIVRQVTEAVQRETGRTLSVADADIRFWPRLAVRLKDVRLSDPPQMDGGRGTFLAVKEVRLAVALGPLLSRRLEVRQIDLDGPDIRLRVDRAGHASWDFSAPGQAPEKGGKAAPDTGADAGPGAAAGFLEQVRLAPVRIAKGRLVYENARSGARLEATEVNLKIHLPRPDAPLSVTGDLVWRQRPVRLGLFVQAPRRLAAQGSGIEARIRVPEIEASYQGLLRLADGLELAGRLEGKGPSLRNLLAWVGSPLAPGRGLGPFAVAGQIEGKGQRFTLKKARLSLDGMNAQGQLSIRFGGARPHVSAALGVDRIDANVYLAPQGADAAKGGGNGKGDRGRGASAGGGDWSDAPIDLSGLKALDADLRLATNAILYRQVKIGRSEIVATLKNGRLQAELKRMAFYGGQAAGRLLLDGSGKVPALSGALTAKNVDGLALLRDFAGIERIKGRLSLELSTAMAGRSQREMISRLKGRARIVFRDGAIRGINIARLMRTVKTAIVNGWQKAPAEKTDFAELSATFDIRDGVAATRDLKLIGPLVRLTGRGEVDLLRRYLDLKVEPRLVASLKGQGGRLEKAGLPVPVIVRGPWDNPKIYPDIEGILKDPEGAYRRLKDLIGRVGKKDLKRGLENVEKKARDVVKGKVRDVKEKAVKELAPVLGEEKAGEVVDKAGKKANKLLKKLFQ